MSKEREYYRKVINEYYQLIVYNNLARAYLGVIVSNQIYEKVVKNKITKLDEKTKNK